MRGKIESISLWGFLKFFEVSLFHIFFSSCKGMNDRKRTRENFDIGYNAMTASSWKLYEGKY